MFENIKNTIDFFLRQNIHFSRKNYIERNEPKEDITEVEKLLIEKYSFSDFRNNSTISNYYQNLYTLDFLDKYLPIENKESLSVLDIGSKNWFYAQAEYLYFKKYSQNLSLDGVEIDAYRLYANLYNRIETAKYYIKDLVGANYIPDDVMNIDKSYDYIVWILPFVIIDPHRYWGLPDKYFNPQKLFEHAYSLLNKGGKMLIINQGEVEFEEQKKLMECYTYNSYELSNNFYEYKHKRYLSVVEKK